VSNPLNPDGLAEIREQYQEIRDRNGGDAQHNPDARAALSLVERLLADADGWGESWTEEAVFFGGPDPENCAKVLVDGPSLDVRDIWDHVDNAGLARRDVRAYRWEVTYEPDDEAPDDGI
jgi:hypothetical protein